MPCSDIDYSLPETFGSTSRVSFGGGGICPPWLWLAPPLYMYILRILFYMQINSNLYKSCNDTINGNLCLCKNSPRFHQIASKKSPKSKFMPLDPLSLPHALHTDIYLPPPIIHTISFCLPLGMKLKETLTSVFLY